MEYIFCHDDPFAELELVHEYLDIFRICTGNLVLIFYFYRDESRFCNYYTYLVLLSPKITP